MDDLQNAALSLFRFVSRAIVQEPEMWRFILQRAGEQANKLDTPVAKQAVEELFRVFTSDPPTSREKLTHLVQRLLEEDAPGATPRKSGKSLAGQTLASALKEFSVRSVA